MANNHNDPFGKQLDIAKKFEVDLLSGVEKPEWPDRIDYVANQLTTGEYQLGIQTKSPRLLSDGTDLERAARTHYLRGIAALTGDVSRETALPETFELGNLLVEFAELEQGLKYVDRHDVPPGEILSRLVVRTVQREADEEKTQLARQLRADTETPRELIAELTATPELAPEVEKALPNPEDSASLTTELASLDLTTELWNHQLESLALWLHHGMNAYVDMATATGKTVLGLAAVAHAVDSGSLHPADQERLRAIFDGNLPEPHRNRPNDVLIVTTDDLLGIQWARLFQEHCHTPPSFTSVGENGIQLPWGRIDIRSASGLRDVDPSEYRLAIFDEVHNYSARSGWGDHLVEFVESPCPVLALTGSVTEQLESMVARVDRPFPLVYRYTHELALADGVIPDFEWTLAFTDVTDSDALAQFRETAQQFYQTAEYDDGTYRVDADSLSSAAPTLTESEVREIAGEYVSGSALAKGLRQTNEDGVAPTDSLESLASGIGNRTIHRLNLRADLDFVIRTAEAALSEGRPVLVLTRSYKESKEVWQALYDGGESRIVKRLEADQSAGKHDEIIRSFDEAETDEKVLIGPGKRIGQGNDIQSVEVGINIARPGSGVNSTLVQRLGRLLRDAGGKDTVNFYHVVGVPPTNAVITPDGESFVRTVAGFFGQVLEPDTDGILKPPTVSINDIEADIVTLEQQGAPCIHNDDQSTVIESAYATAISEQSESGDPAVTTDWFSAAFGVEAQPSVLNGGSDGRVRQYNDGQTRKAKTSSKDEGSQEVVDSTNGISTGPSQTSGTSTGENSAEGRAATGERKLDGETDDNRDNTAGYSPTTESKNGETGRTETVAVERVSPLAEHYDAFRNLGIIHKSLRESAESDIPESDPLGSWMEDIRSILTDTGYGDQRTGYGRQQEMRSPIAMSEYRNEHGTGNRVTEFEVVSVRELSKAVVALLKGSLSGLSAWVVPVAPKSEVPLPVIVESEAELTRARGLLDEFPAEPPIFVDEGPDSSGESATPQTPTGSVESEVAGKQTEEPPEHRDSSFVSVADVRGVSNSTAEALQEAGYEQLVDLQTASNEELEAVEGISEQRVQFIRMIVGSR